MRIAINGFGRIGRTFLRTLLTDQLAQKKITVVAINIGPANPDQIVYMVKYDSVMGTYRGEVSLSDGYLVIDGYKIKIIASRDIQKIDWGVLKIDWVVEASGKFTKRADAALHIESGAHNVLITAPAQGEDVTIIPGVNDDAFDPSLHHIVSLGSCSTNALMPMLKVLHDSFGIEKAYMTSVHAYTNSQVLLDVEHKDIRRSRAAALNIIPTSSGATESVEKVMPELTGKVEGVSLRVPVAKVSLLDLTVTVKEQSMTAEILNEAFVRAKKSERMRNIIGITHEELVSSDFAGTKESVIIDAPLTCALGNTGKIFGWYDNEWAYCERLKDFLLSIT